MQMQQHHRYYFFFLGIGLFILRIRCSSESDNSSHDDDDYYYRQCRPSTCGGSVVQFPFGLNPLCRSAYITTVCENNTLFITNDDNPHIKYKLLHNLTKEVYANRSISLVDVSLLGCGTIPGNIYGSQPRFPNWVTQGAFRYTNDYMPATFLNCTQEIQLRLMKCPCLDCPGGGDHQDSSFCYCHDGLMNSVSNYCNSFGTDIKSSVFYNMSAVGNLRTLLQEGFTVGWDEGIDCDLSCLISMDDMDDHPTHRGRCGYLNDQGRKRGEEVCFCNDGVHKHNCSDGLLVELGGVAKGHGSRRHTHKVAIISLGVVGLGAGLVSICMGCYFYFKKKWSLRSQDNFFGGEDDEALRRYLEGDKTTPASIETFLQNYTLGRPTRFSYKQLKRYTNNFTHKLGQGGSGSVFKGKLPNGLFIAVKLLNYTDQSEAQLINEVRIIGQIHHNHLVRLLGYCFEHSRQLLVYEFMENGSLDRYIIHDGQDDQKTATAEKLSWSQLHDIAVGAARGIMYLHEECSTRILHCDIKPHNILLDRNFRPKVSDFGLALALSRERSGVSLTHGVGTPGYAPPEMWWMNRGPVSDKSDVYSFGMVMLEMTKKGKNHHVTHDVSSSSKMCFPDHEWVYFHHAGSPISSSSGGGPKWHGGNSTEEGMIAERMELVALWCIQFEQSKRPSMRRVIEMLEGDVVIEIPPPLSDPRTFSTI